MIEKNSKVKVEDLSLTLMTFLNSVTIKYSRKSSKQKRACESFPTAFKLKVQPIGRWKLVVDICNNCVTCFVIKFVDGFFVISIGFLDIN